MAMTREYLELVESGIDIAPVGSQEEVQAAEYMLDAFEEHELETELQDLSAPLYSRVFTGIALALMMLAAILSGLGGIGWALGGFLGALVVSAYLASDHLGVNPLSDVGPRAESQNVIGIHRAEGPMAGRGVRPIVVLCRYDTGREELFAKPAIAPFVPLVKRVAPWCVGIVLVGTILQLFQFMSGPALIALWVITMVAGLPLAILAMNEITAPFLNLTDGANDNKASLGALLGILEDVVPTDETRLRVRAAQLAEASQANKGVEPGEDGLFYEEYEVYEDVPVIGTRHGRQVLEAIGMLPPTCEIVYEKPGRRRVIKRRVVDLPPQAPRDLDVSDQPTESDVALVEERPTEPGGPRLVMVSDRGARRAADEPAVEEDGGATEPFELVVAESSDEVAEEKRPPERATDVQRLQIDAAGVEGWGVSEFDHGDTRTRRSLLFDLPDPSEDARDPLLAETEGEGIAEDRPTELVSVEEVEEHVERSADDDRPDERHGRRHRGRRGGDGEPKRSLRDRLPFGHRKQKDESLSEWLDVAEDYDARTEGEEIGSWDNFGSGEEDDWRGGATRSVNARDRLRRIRAMADEVEGEIEDHGLVERDGGAREIETRIPEVPDGATDDPRPLGTGAFDLVQGAVPPDELGDDVAEEAAIASLDAAAEFEDEGVVPDVEVIGAPSDDELADSVLEMGDVNLVAHDIWFVCVGASALAHAGTKAFVEAHRRELRGCFVLNLDSIGAGDLTALTSEGYGDTRKGDRMIQKLLDTASKVVHVPVMLSTHEWEDTDATPALRRSMRGLTLMGTMGGKQRALANTPDDVAENLNPNQVVYVSQLVSELIRRS